MTEPGARPTMSIHTSIESKLILPDAANHTNLAFVTVIRLLNQSATEDVTSILCYYASAVIALYHNLEGVMTDVLSSKGIRLTKIRLPSQAAENNIEMDLTSGGYKVLIMLGQLLMLPFKNFTPQNYLNFTNKRIRAMRSFMGVLCSEQQLLAIADVEKVKHIRSVFGRNIRFRQAVIRNIINGCGADYHIGDLCTYVSEILAWTDMGPIKLIADTFLEDKSPVLEDHRVQDEVRLFNEAMDVITRCEFPQYYGILGPTTNMYMLEGTKYPFLLGVAQKLESETYPTRPRFPSTINGNHATVIDLVNIHKRHMMLETTQQQNATLRYLRSFSGQGGGVQELTSTNPFRHLNLNYPGQDQAGPRRANGNNAEYEDS